MRMQMQGQFQKKTVMVLLPWWSGSKVRQRQSLVSTTTGGERVDDTMLCDGHH